MPALGLKLRLNRISARILSVITTNLQLWSKMILSPYTGGARILDASTAGNNGNAYTGRAMSFDGVNDVITIGNTGQSVRTVVMWIYPSTTTQSFCQLTASGGVDLGISSGTLSGAGWTSPTYYVNGAAGSTGITANVWRMVAVTSATAVTASDVRLGLDNTTYYGGRLANVIFYNVELSAAQIAELYAYPEKPIPTGITAANVVGWWPLAESVGVSIAFDGSGNGNNGAISGASDSLAQNGAVPQWGFVSNNWPMYWGDTDDFVSCGTTTGSLTITGNKLTIYLKCATTAPQNNSFDHHLIRGSGGLNQGYFVGRLSNNRISFGTYGLTTGNGDLNTDIGDVPENDTLNIICIYDGTNKYIYVNGVLEKSIAATGDIASYTSQALRIGNTSTVNIRGVIFEAGVWNEALTTTQIAAIQSGTKFETIQTANLQGAWRNTGNTNADWLDLSGNGNNGTVNGSPGRVFLPEGETAGKDIVSMNLSHPVNAQFYDTTDGYIEVADAASLDITSAITLEAWVKPEVVNVAQTVIGKNSAYALNITSGAKLQFQRWSGTTSGTVASSASLVAGGWRHIAATYNGTTTLLYINGALDTTSTAISGAIDATSTAALIGALTSSTQQFTGYIDDVRIYSSVLTAAQILNNYKATKAAHS